MLGIQDWGIAGAYLLSFATTLFCGLYALWAGRKQ